MGAETDQAMSHVEESFEPTLEFCELCQDWIRYEDVTIHF
jgi:hypothetical protein